MTANQLLRLYPRAWRERYGQEFLDTTGARQLRAQHVVDIVMGAVDAWLSSDVRRATARGAVAANGGGQAMTGFLKSMACMDSRVRYTTRDLVISALVLIACVIVMSAAGIAANRAGHALLGESLKSLAFPVSVLISMPFGIFKGQPWRAQVGVLGLTFAILLAATWLANKI